MNVAARKEDWRRRAFRLVGLSLMLPGLLAPSCSGGAQPPGAAQPSLPVLTQAVAVLNLTAAEARKKYPVKFQGVLTCFNPRYKLCFVQDATAGIYVFQPREAGELKTGKRVEVTGVSGYGQLAPFVNGAEVKVLGAGQMPPPRPVPIEALASSKEDGQWVEVEGIVRETIEGSQSLAVILAQGNSRLKLQILERPSGGKTNLVDAKVRARGVVGAVFDKKNQWTGSRMFVSTVEDLIVEQAAPADPFSLPLHTNRNLIVYSRGEAAEHRVRLQGVVLMQSPGRCLFVQRQEGGPVIQVQTGQTPPVRAGDFVEAAGFPAYTGANPVLQDAVFRRLGVTPLPKPKAWDWERLRAGELNWELVQVEAELVQQARTETGVRTLFLKKDELALTAILEAAPDQKRTSALADGSRLRVTGIADCNLKEGRALPEVRLWLRSLEDIVVLQASVSSKRGTFVWGWILLVTTLLFGIFAWRRWWDYRCAMAMQDRVEAELRESDELLRNSLERRERLGRDLHDSIIQSIYSVGLRLENCRQLIREDPPNAEARLAGVLEELNAVIRELRGFIKGLEPEFLKGRELKAALKSLVLTMGETRPDQFYLQIDSQAADELAPTVALQLLHIAREAMSNSLRHAQATTTTISLQKQSGCVRLEVSDDGVGFDPQALPPDGRGLHNIHSRAVELGARYEVISLPGKGTKVVIEIPQRPPA